MQHVVTKPSALEGIILRGIVPGGNDSARRLAVHFGVFAPGDSENISTKTATHDVKEGDDLIAIYVPTRKLSVYQSGVTSGGTIVPFQRDQCNLEIQVESEICPGFKDAVGVSPADFLGNLNSFLDDEDSADAEILKKMVVKACVNIEVPELLNNSLVEIRDLLSRFIVYREDDPSSISNRVCPACAVIIRRGFCYCTACDCELISTGKFVIHMGEDEPKPSDTANVTEEVKQAQREAKEDAERIVAEEERPDTNEMSEGRSADRSYLPSDIGTDVDHDDAGVCPDNPEEDADAIHLQSASTSLARHHTSLASLASYFSKWKVFANNEADLVKEAGKGGGV